MSDVFDPGWFNRLRLTPAKDLLRGKISGHLNWRYAIASSGLPKPISDLVFRVVKRTRLWRAERRSVADELISHFHDGLAAGETEANLIAAFGDEKAAAKLIRRST